jgi:thymidylate synthase ThyX
MSQSSFSRLISKITIVSYSKPDTRLLQDGISDMKDLVAYCARVSNPSNQTNTETAERLIRYLAKNSHWSPFELVNVCIEIETTRDIARQILRHRSMSFQEFCLSGDTEIYVTSPTAAKTKLSLLYKVWKTSYGLPNHKLKVYDENTNSFVSTNIREIFYTGKKPVYKVTTSDGKNIKTTKEHKFLTRYGFDTLENIMNRNSNTQIAITELVVCCNKPKFVDIVDIQLVGEEDTYDIEVDHESHNYVGNGFVVHNSQRYANPLDSLTFVTREARLQDQKNRQNSISVDNPDLQQEWDKKQEEVIQKSKEAYLWALEKGIAKEQARAVLPEGCTMSRMYVNGTLRSWIHYCELRSENGTQKEHADIAKACAKIISELFPIDKLN